MNKFSFVDYVWEIWTVGKVNNVDVGVAYDMVRADIQNGHAEESNTDKALPKFNFAKVKIEWDKLSIEEKKEAYTEWHEMLREYYFDLCELFDALTK